MRLTKSLILLFWTNNTFPINFNLVQEGFFLNTCCIHIIIKLLALFFFKMVLKVDKIIKTNENKILCEKAVKDYDWL